MWTSPYAISGKILMLQEILKWSHKFSFLFYRSKIFKCSFKIRVSRDFCWTERSFVDLVVAGNFHGFLLLDLRSFEWFLLCEVSGSLSIVSFDESWVTWVIESLLGDFSGFVVTYFLIFHRVFFFIVSEALIFFIIMLFHWRSIFSTKFSTQSESSNQ